MISGPRTISDCCGGKNAERREFPLPWLDEKSEMKNDRTPFVAFNLRQVKKVHGKIALLEISDVARNE
jgi:hypothetical protein